METRGVQLDVLIEYLDQHNMVVDWIDFYEQGVEHNWNIKTIRSKIMTSLIDVKGKEYCDEVMFRLNHYLKKKYGSFV